MEPGGAVAEVQCIVMAGDDARHFAQSQFAGDVQTLGPGRWQWNAWLDASGRVEALMQLADAGDGTLLALLRGSDATRVHAALARYLLRAQATLAVRACAASAGPALGAGTVVRDGSDLLIGFGARSLRLVPGPAAVDPHASAAWRLADIRSGWPVLPAHGARFLPPALGLERLGAISFDKGCFPGQEIAARLHFRGGHKRRLQHVRGTPPLPTGEVDGSVEAGQVYVLDSVGVDGGSESLVVAPKHNNNKISIMHHTYDVISIFEP